MGRLGENSGYEGLKDVMDRGLLAWAPICAIYALGKMRVNNNRGSNDASIALDHMGDLSMILSCRFCLFSTSLPDPSPIHLFPERWILLRCTSVSKCRPCTLPGFFRSGELQTMRSSTEPRPPRTNGRDEERPEKFRVRGQIHWTVPTRDDRPAKDARIFMD